MSVYLHLGQCGNQIGAAYWRLAAAASYNRDDDRIQVNSDVTRQRLRASNNAAIGDQKPLSRHFFHPSSGAARCILVDSEPKVVQSVCKPTTDSVFSFRPAYAHVQQAGRGNNWAMGYYGPKLKSPPLKYTSELVDDRKDLIDLVMESLRRESESVDYYQGSIVMHSLGGGTGSGLGCRVMERIRDTYPKAYLVTASVAPSCTRGDTPLQNYNAVLTLKCLQEVADAVIYKDNDDMLRTASYWKSLISNSVGKGTANQRVSLEETNCMAAADLAGLLFPVAAGDASTMQPFDFGKLVHDVCPMPTAKVLDVRSGLGRDHAQSSERGKLSLSKTAFSAPLFHAPVVNQVRMLAHQHGRAPDFDSCLDLLQKLLQQTTGSFPRSSHAALASSTIVRGFCPSINEIDRFSNELRHTVQNAFPSVPWMATMPQTTVAYSKPAPFALLQAKVSATICVNNGNFLGSTKHLLERAQHQFHAGAYVHWYKQLGMEDADFENAFDKCATLVNEYETLL